MIGERRPGADEVDEGGVFDLGVDVEGIFAMVLEDGFDGRQVGADNRARGCERGKQAEQGELNYWGVLLLDRRGVAGLSHCCSFWRIGGGKVQDGLQLCHSFIVHESCASSPVCLMMIADPRGSPGRQGWHLR